MGKKEFEKEEERQILEAFYGKKSNMEKIIDMMEEQIEVKALKSGLMANLEDLQNTSDQEWTKDRLDKLLNAVSLITELLVEYDK